MLCSVADETCPRGCLGLGVNKKKMGFLDALFGTSPSPEKDDDDDKSTYARPQNSAEQQASADYLTENFQTGADPVPDEPPDWAKSLPNPGDFKQETEEK